MAKKHLNLEEPILDAKEAVLVGEIQEAQIRFSKFYKNLINELNPNSSFYFLGSLGTNSLCPLSDIDILFVGSEVEAEAWSLKFKTLQLPLKIRVPGDLKHWSLDTDIFGILSILNASQNSRSATALLVEQKNKIRALGASELGEFYSQLLLEQEQRHKRYGLSSGLMQPNLKFSKGGLRDISQSLGLLEFYFFDSIPKKDLIFKRLEQIKKKLNQYRFIAALFYNQEVFSFEVQHEIATQILKVKTKDFSKSLQILMSEASLLTEAVFTQASEWFKENSKKTPESQSVKQFIQGPQIRTSVEYTLGLSQWSDSDYLSLKKDFFSQLEFGVLPEYTRFLFESQSIVKIIPEIKPLLGLVQPDHYHKYTASRHILKTLQAVKKFKADPSLFYSLESLIKQRGDELWSSLFLTALFHDLGKGRKTDHSVFGAQILKKYQREISEEKFKKVSSLVKHHLWLSHYSFRAQVDQSVILPEGLDRESLTDLALFTALDIFGTQPQAWNQWKARSIAHTYEVLTSQDSQLDSYPIPDSDYEKLVERIQTETKEKLKVYEHNSRVWLCWYLPYDEKYILKKQVEALYSLGFDIDEAIIQSLFRKNEESFVLNWFKLSENADIKSVKSRIKFLDINRVSPAPPSVYKFKSIKKKSYNGEEVLVYRGKNHKGILLEAINDVYNRGYSITWAKVNTWGELVEDVFGIKKS